MKKLALVVALLVSIGLVSSLCAEPASAFFGGFGSFFGKAKAPCAPMYCAPYYFCCPYVPCKPVKKVKKAAPAAKPAKEMKKK